MKWTTAHMIVLACMIAQTSCSDASSPSNQVAGKSQTGSNEQAGAAKDTSVSLAITKLFGKELVNAQKQKVPVNALAGKKLGIYFSAHWCPPCRQFTPQLVSFYNDLRKQGKAFEIVFVSSDRTEKDMYIYMKEMAMPWLALPFDSGNKAELGQKFGIRGIPTLVVVNAEGKTLTADGRGDVMSLGTKAFDKW